MIFRTTGNTLTYINYLALGLALYKEVAASNEVRLWHISVTTW